MRHFLTMSLQTEKYSNVFFPMKILPSGKLPGHFVTGLNFMRNIADNLQALLEFRGGDIMVYFCIMSVTLCSLS